MSLMISPSQVLRTGLLEVQAAEFNGSLSTACQAAGVAEFGFSWPGLDLRPRSCFEGNRTLGQLMELEEPDFPAVTWWIGSGQDLNNQKPKAFSGVVMASWRFFLTVRGKSSAGLAEMRQAVESALGGMLFDADLDRASYRKDLTWGEPVEQQWVDQDSRHVGWLQEVQFNASFEVNV